MPIQPVQFLDRRDGNRLLQDIIAGQNASLTNVLSSAVQLTRDANSNQLNQELGALRAIESARDFSENRFRDRRNFEETTFRDRRDFIEGVRRFQALDADRDAARGLQAELGRARLDISRQGLGLQSRGLALRERESDFRFGELNRQREEELFRLDQLDLARARAEIASDPALFAERNPTLSGAELEERRQIELGSVQRDFLFLDRPNLARAVTPTGAGRSILPSIRDEQAQILADEAQGLIEGGDLENGLQRLVEARASAEPGSPTEALIGEQIRQRQGVPPEQLSATAAESSFNIFNSNRTKDFGDTNYEAEVQAVLSAGSRESYARSVPEGLDDRRDADRRAQTRAAFYDAVRASSATDRLRVRAGDDPFAGILPPIEVE